MLPTKRDIANSKDLQKCINKYVMQESMLSPSPITLIQPHSLFHTDLLVKSIQNFETPKDMQPQEVDMFKRKMKISVEKFMKIQEMKYLRERSKQSKIEEFLEQQRSAS